MAKGKLAWLTHFSVCHLHRSDVGEQLAFQKVTQSLLVMLCLRGFIWVSNSFKSPQKKNRGTFEVLNFECTWLQKHKLLGEFHVYLWSSKHRWLSKLVGSIYVFLESILQTCTVLKLTGNAYEIANCQTPMYVFLSQRHKTKMTVCPHSYSKKCLVHPYC